MVNTKEMAPSPRQPFSRQGVGRIPGFIKLRIGAINVATLREKEEEIIEVMKTKKLSLLAVSETRLRGTGDKIMHDDYRLVYSGGEGTRHGVGFIIEPGLAQYLEKVIPLNDRLIGIDLKLEGGISMIQVYAPQQGRPTMEKEEFYQQLQELMEEMKYQDNIKVCGDLNGHIGRDREMYEQNIGTHGIGNRNEAGLRVLEFAQINNLQIMNTYFQHRESHKWTWYRYDQQQMNYTQKSVIDLFLTNKKRIFMDVKAVPLLSMDGDHRLVLAKIRITKPKETKGKGAKRYKLNRLNDQLVVDELRNKIQNNVHDNINVDETNVEVIWKNFKEAALQAAEEVLGEKTPYRGSKKRTPWWGEEVKTAVRSKIKHFRIWMKSRSVEDRQAYVQTRNEAQRVKRKSKEESWRKIGEDLKADFKGTKKLLYNLANNYRGKRQCISYAIKDKNDYLLTESGEIAER